MSIEQSVVRDERTVAVENASFKWAYYFLAFGVLIDAYYRGKVWNEAVWDLVALACVSSVIQLVHVVANKAWVSDWPWRPRTTAIVCAVCFVVAVLAVLVSAVMLR